uniref:MATH domain-containing protein n=1 Tax=Ditylenchus dipsaci TaxID=166011 RepID=A0A915DYP2_9BILA
MVDPEEFVEMLNVIYPHKKLITALAGGFELLIVPLVNIRCWNLSQCCGVTGDPDWKCSAMATLIMQSQKEGIPHHQHSISHEFCETEDDWGYSQFCTVASLLDPNNGFILEVLL